MNRIALFGLFLATLLYAQTPTLAPAKWVWDQADAHRSPQSNAPRYLRRTFELAGPVKKAELLITVDNVYVAWVNGHKIGGDSAWESIDRHDVTKHLAPGKNVLAVEAVNQGGVAGAIAKLSITLADGKDVVIVSDAQMRATQQKHAGWEKSDFDDRDWANAVELGDASIGPWNKGAPTASKSGKPAPGSFDFATVDPKVKDRQPAVDQVKNFIVPEGFEVELVAADPLIINPVTMALDEQGRIYVSESHTYRFGPKGSPIKPYANPVVRLDKGADGKLQRTLVTEGYEDPVMGMAIKNGKMWLTACTHLYTLDLSEDGLAGNKKVLVTDKNKAWNPFGMFVLEWGPDGLLYMSVGNHQIDLVGPDGRMSGRGSSGIVLRMNPDGTKMERLVHGLRVPYSFEFDPFGQLWLLSNGEGNPNRFVRVIDGVDYHCYTRTNDAQWLSGQNPLAPPCFELHRGADTQLMRYFGAAYPSSYQGSLFVCNWGGHGFPGLNRGIFRFVPDERNNIIKKEPFVLCSDPYFRPSHIALDNEGNLLIADWYGRDDESDLTGRIWRVKYKGADAPAKIPPSPIANHLNDSNVHEVGLGSRSHVVRKAAMEHLASRGADFGKLDLAARNKDNAMAAANALWVAIQSVPRGEKTLAAAADNPDWRVRRLAVNLARRYQTAGAKDLAAKLATDADPAVRVEAGIALRSPAVLLDALSAGAAKDAHLRYEAAWHFGKHATTADFEKILFHEDDAIRLAGLIAVDVACYEGFDSRKSALASLGKALETPGYASLDLALQVAQLNGDATLASPLSNLLKRDDVSPAVTAKAILIMKSKVGGMSMAEKGKLGKKFIESVAKGTVAVNKPEDQVVFLEFLESEGPTPFALRYVAQSIQGGQPQVRQAALALARRFGKEGQGLADDLWRGVLAGNLKADDRAEYLATIAAVEAKPDAERWRKVLTASDRLLATDAVRNWRRFKGQADLVRILAEESPALVQRHEGLFEDLAAVARELNVKVSAAAAAPSKDKDELAKYALAQIAKLTPAESKDRAILGRQVFERSACTKCHTAVTQNTPLAPSLKGIAAQKLDYLVESVLYPSKVIKTGFETEVIVTKNGQTLAGLVKEEDAFLRVLNLDKDTRIAKADVEERSVQKLSIMPEGQEAVLSRPEFVDLIVYLATLK
jgi:putative membrane-bound dehydrogenase-like protein